MNISINFWAVLVAAIASMVVGSVWYGPLFGKAFMSAVGMDMWTAEKKAEMKKGMIATYIWQFIASIVMFFILALLMGATHHTTVMSGMALAFLLWLGFVVPLKLGDALWGGKMAMFWLGIGDMLVTLLVAGAIIGAWH